VDDPADSLNDWANPAAFKKDMPLQRKNLQIFENKMQ